MYNNNRKVIIPQDNDFDGEYKKAEQRMRNRHKKWRELPKLTQSKLAGDIHADMVKVTQHEGFIDFSMARNQQLSDKLSNRWPIRLEYISHAIIILVSVGGFSAIPLFLFKQIDNPFWTVAAILGGLIGYVVHFSATKLFVNIRLKENYEKSLESIKGNTNEK